jgi:pimeloyl-ACP methyl ester carboxylesterase
LNSDRSFVTLTRLVDEGTPRNAVYRFTTLSLLMLAGLVAGCADPKEKFGHTWYIDGAGNWGFGVLDVPIGLEQAGYKGLVSNHHWSLTLNPALDQTLRFIARASAAVLSGGITDFLKQHPGAEANIIALSAGTGVALWAVEDLKPPYKVNNVVLLGSSLSSRYDCRKALANMKGNIYVYYAASDPVLQGPVRVLGTIDGTFDDAAGLVGLRGPGKETGRIRNIGWSPRYEALGWTGGHADCTNARFVRAEISKHIVRTGAGRPSPAKEIRDQTIALQPVGAPADPARFQTTFLAIP